MERRNCPVFVMGCHRSGTNLLYDTLLSAGGFAVYRGYLPVYKMLVPRFGGMDKAENRKQAVETWIRSKGFRRSGLNAEQLIERVLNECRSGGDFIRTVMDEISRSQNVARWAVYDPDNLLYISNIKADIPEALFVHIIRDGRDVALSLSKMGGFRPFPWNRAGKGLLPAALYWEWMVRKGQEHGRRIPSDYLEVRYEEFVSAPHVALKKLGEFLDHDLHYDRIQQASLGRLRKPNSSFPEDGQGSPAHRWTNKLSKDEVASIERLVGKCLGNLDYSLSSSDGAGKSGLREKLMRGFYFGVLNAKLWMKTRTSAGRLANLEALELVDAAGRVDAE
jgi:hypothetical protein